MTPEEHIDELEQIIARNDADIQKLEESHAELLAALKLAIKTVECDSIGEDGEELPWHRAAVRAIACAERLNSPPAS